MVRTNIEQGSAGPKYDQKWARSTAWGVEQYLKGVSKEYAMQAEKLSQLCKSITKDDKLAKYTKDTLNKWMDNDQKLIRDRLNKPKAKKGEDPVFAVEDMPDDQTTGSSSTPQVSLNCFGTGTKTYISQGVLAGNIKDYCSQAAKQGVQDSGSGSLGREFNMNTPEHVFITMTWPSGMDFKLSEDDCNKYMGDMVMDGCDGNDPENPMNWKHGGKVQVDKVEYAIQPATPRHQPAPKAPGGGCDVQYKFLYDDFWIWGWGWANSDGGQRLMDNLNGCTGDGYDFRYGVGDDGRDWTITGSTWVFQKSCIQNAIVGAGGPRLSCTGGG